ncbi:hypothetical protein [Christiangramia sp.]|uniref:hypothetical protein n=1 Tax=Christiangramia sp. TaxID=1931228 RepID=UPI00260763D6|nr:hypothetical protein [Christiangramia sp.]
MPVTKFEKLKADFEHELTSAKNQPFFIERELKAINERISAKSNNGLGVNQHLGKPLEFSESVFDQNIISSDYPFREAFNSFLINDEFEDPSGSEEIVDQARELSRYYSYLQSKTAPIEKQSVKKDNSLTLKQKLLVISYLNEISLSNVNNSQLAKILSQVLERSEENIRKTLTYLHAGKNEVRTKNNLEKISKLFKDESFGEISEKIQQDLDKMK